MNKIANVDIICDLAAWPRYPTNNFKFKNCLFGETSIVKNSDKEKYVYSRFGITFESAGPRCYSNGTARNVIIFGVDNSIIFGVDNSSLSHTDNCKKTF